MLKTLNNLKPSWFKSLKSDDVSTFAQCHYQVSDERNENEYKCKRISFQTNKFSLLFVSKEFFYIYIRFHFAHHWLDNDIEQTSKRRRFLNF